MADAIEQGADTILTCGAVQSNHCRLTLSAAVKEGLDCQLVLEEKVLTSYDKEVSVLIKKIIKNKVNLC